MQGTCWTPVTPTWWLTEASKIEKRVKFRRKKHKLYKNNCKIYKKKCVQFFQERKKKRVKFTEKKVQILQIKCTNVTKNCNSYRKSVKFTEYSGFLYEKVQIV